MNDLENRMLTEWEKVENQKILSHLNKIIGITKEEINQLKYITLWKTIRTFNKNKNVKFSTHLYNTCRYVYLDEITRINKYNQEVSIDTMDYLEHGTSSARQNYISDLFLIIERKELPEPFNEIIKDIYVDCLNFNQMLKKHNLRKKEFYSLKEESLQKLKEYLNG